MRKVLVVVFLAVAVAVALLLASMTTDERADRESVDLGSARADRTREAAGSDGTDAGGVPSGGSGGAAGVYRADVASRIKSVPRRRRLLYQDGKPAAGVTIRCASGGKIVTKVFRNGDYPHKTIWMITHQSNVTTDSDGWFTLHPGPGATDAVFYTDPDSTAVLLEPFEEVLTEYRAARRAKVTGKLRTSDGVASEYVWLSAQRGRPEDYDTRNYQEDPSFVAARGGLEIDPNGKCETETDSEGRFTLLLAPGLNTLSFGESGQGGSVPVIVPESGDLDLGDVVQPPPSAAQRSNVPRELRGTVNSMSGKPLADALVRLWDGNVGEASHAVRTDKTGSWSVTGLHGHRVIAWALSSERHHMVLPEQSSGTIHMPCNTPVTLVAPGADEYAWVRVPHANGFFLFERAGVLLGGELLSSDDTVGLPQGRYRIFGVTDRGILELAKDLRTGGTHELEGLR